MLKLDNLQLGQKFTLLLLLVFLGGIIASSMALLDSRKFSVV
jgi:hypothetical protein